MTSQQKKLHLQGLRGFAIVSVVLFHFYPEWCPNGYLGVDQFFLLSGYLMTMMLHRHPSLDSVKILDFLYRRIKRIVPLYFLVCFLILLSLNYVPSSAINTNAFSSISALTFSTNLIRPLGMAGYAEKLGIAVDLYTHTWSLSLEMQFYLLFPFIFILVMHFRENQRIYVISLLAASSMAFYIFSDTFLSFNSVFSRIWQFLAGMFIFLGEVEKKSCSEAEEKLLEDEDSREQNKDLKKLVWIIVAISICSLAFLMLGHRVIDPFFGRVNTILLTALVVHLGENFPLLECRFLTHLGEISYSWYLLHWPIVALCKMNRFNEEIELGYGLVTSIVFSLILHHFFEKFYLKWEKKTIGSFLLFLLVINGAALSQIYVKMMRIAIILPSTEGMLKNQSSDANFTIRATQNPYIFPSDSLGHVSGGYENMTNEQRASLNDALDANDVGQLFEHPCDRITTDNKQEIRCKVGEINNSTNLTLLVMGNSWSSNQMGIIHQECRDVFSEMHMSTIAACEPVVQSQIYGYDCRFDYNYKNAVETYKPDVLIVVFRHISNMLIFDGNNPFDDQLFKSSIRKIQELEPFVSKKIYLLDVFPSPSTNVTAILNEFLRKGTPFTDSQLTDLSQNYLVAKERMFRLAEGCSKCELFDYAPQFFFKGELKIYDPEYHVTFFTKGQHITPPGLERIRPVIHRICHNL